MKAHTRETLRRRMAHVTDSINKVDSKLYSGEIDDAHIDCLAIDAKRLADYCQFIRNKLLNRSFQQTGE